MARSLTIPKPSLADVRRLLRLLETTEDAHHQRKAETILLFALGLTTPQIAQTLGQHPNTIRTRLHAFDQHRWDWMQNSLQRGRRPRLTPDQVAHICHLAHQSPHEVGLPYGGWSLSTLKEYVTKQKVVQTISREHLRQLLKKTVFTAAWCSANSSVPTPSAPRF